jgi:predicted Zn-dependent protease
MIGLLLGQNPNALRNRGAVAGGTMARFSRADEKQADEMGLDFMAQAGYDPHGMLDMFQKLLALDKSNPGAVARFFQDHPGTQDRINDISGRIAKVGRAGGIVDDPEYQVVKRRLGL